MVAVGERRRWEVADIVRRHGDTYQRSHRLSFLEQKALWAIGNCRTTTLGGHLEKCNRCGHERPCYNSCRNRHCPKCQALTKARWLEARRAEILPVPYFHVVFTLPHEINAPALKNKKVVYDLLFRSVSKTLLAFGKETLGGRIAATMILHTWDQQLRNHLHVHCAIPAGALAYDDQRFVHARRNFLFPVKAMAVMFRGKFLAGLKKLKLGENEWIHALYEKDWVVYSKPAFPGAANVLDYLGRYTHRIAISNNRILDVKDERVTFSYRDRNDGNQTKAMTVTAHEFLRRFLLHVLPGSFVKIRHIGFLSNARKARDVQRCRELLGTPPIVRLEAKSTRDLLKELTGVDLDRCPRCHEGRMVIVADIPKRRLDSS